MRLRMIVLSLILIGAAGTGRAGQVLAQQQPPPDFVPVENAPPGEQIPAMPLLGAAYGFIWVGVFGYVWSIARRLKQVETELTELESRRT
jgi:CcmD family protein